MPAVGANHDGQKTVQHEAIRNKFASGLWGPLRPAMHAPSQMSSTGDERADPVFPDARLVARRVPTANKERGGGCGIVTMERLVFEETPAPFEM